MVKTSDHSLNFWCGNHFMKFRNNKRSVLRDRCGKPKIKMASNMVKVSRSHDIPYSYMEWDFLQCTVTAQKPMMYINSIQGMYIVALLFIYLF